MLKMKGLVEYGVRQLFLVLFLFDVMHWMSCGAQYSLYGASRHGLIFYAEIERGNRGQGGEEKYLACKSIYVQSR